MPMRKAMREAADGPVGSTRTRRSRRLSDGRRRRYDDPTVRGSSPLSEEDRTVRMVNSLSQKLIQLTMPVCRCLPRKRAVRGSLVDPDNRAQSTSTSAGLYWRTGRVSLPDTRTRLRSCGCNQA